MSFDTEPVGLTPTRVLLVEDDASLAEVTAEFLRIEGMEVRIAAFGQEALALAMAFRPDIVLCDMRLPDMWGLDAVHVLRSNPKTKNALIAIYTAVSDRDARALERENQSDEVDLVLSKPLTEEKIHRLLERLATRGDPPQSQNRKAG
jgi:CheY-like chemotaxis protein